MQPRVWTILTLAALLLVGALFLPEQSRPAQATVVHSEYANLLAFYRDTGGRTHWRAECRRQWNNERAELRPGESAADYPSSVLTLSGGQAVAIRLRDCGLTGRIPAALTQLTGLRILDLSDNDLSGTIPAEMENLDKLTILDLSGNKLNGEIPGQLGNIPNLERLRLNNNRLDGELPIQFGNLIRLKELNVTRNHLTGVVPPTFKNLFTLEAIYLQNGSGGNRFYGCINIPPKNSNAGVPYCQNGNIPTPVPTRVPFPTPTYTPVPTYTPRPTYTPAPTWTPVPTHTPIPTATPVVKPEAHLTAARTEVRTGEPIKVTLTTVGHPAEWRALNLTLRATNGATLSGDDMECASNLCSYKGEYQPAELRTFNVTAIARQPGSFSIDGDALWYSDLDLKGNPLKESIPEIVIAAKSHSPVILHTTQTQAAVGEDVVVTLTANNSITAPPMTVNMILRVPAGWSPNAAQSAARCYPSHCSLVVADIQPGVSRDIQTTLIPNETGDFIISGELEWFFGKDLSTRDEKTTPLPVVVGPGAAPTPSPVPTPPPATAAPPPADNPEPPPTAPAAVATATLSTPTGTPATATPTSAPDVVVTTPGGSGEGSCNATLDGSSGIGGDMAWLGLALLGLIGWVGRRRKS